MDGLVRFLYAAGLILLAFVIALLLVVGLFFIKPYLTSREPKLSLELNEVIVRSREIVNSYWQKHEHCPTAQDLESIKQLTLVGEVKVISVGDRQCLLKIKVFIKEGRGNIISQRISFTKIQESRVNYNCYHNSVTQQMPYNCKKVRNIDSFY